MKPFIQQPTDSILTKYPEPIELADKQLEVFWLPGEINVDKDVQSILVNLSEAKKHAVLTTLRLFTLYELRAGADYWGERFTKVFPRPEFRRMASVFSMFELAVHAPFYNKLNEALNVATDAFYLDYVNSPVLKARMEFIDRILNGDNDLVSVAVFSLIEGAVLYSSFGYLKHFQANGNNELANVVRGIDFSVRDENFHAMGGAYAYQALRKESNLSVMRNVENEEAIYQAMLQLQQHEEQIIDMMHEQGDPGLSKEAMKQFSRHRLVHCFNNLDPVDKVIDNGPGPIGKWFYKNINDFKFNDFFAGVGREYKRNWDFEEVTF